MFSPQPMIPVPVANTKCVGARYGGDMQTEAAIHFYVAWADWENEVSFIHTIRILGRFNFKKELELLHLPVMIFFSSTYPSCSHILDSDTHLPSESSPVLL